jgi:hypothetical protein
MLMAYARSCRPGMIHGGGKAVTVVVPDWPTLEREVHAWEDRRNTHHNKADWHFSGTLQRSMPA